MFVIDDDDGGGNRDDGADRRQPGVKFWTKRCKGSRRKVVGVTA